MTTASDDREYGNSLEIDPGKSGIYIHIPFCVKKCHYCAFLSGPADDDMIDRYVDALIGEIELRAEPERKCDTIYIGGGTPSLLPPDQIERILYALYDAYDFSPGIPSREIMNGNAGIPSRKIMNGNAGIPSCEITIESNPATLTPDKVASYRRSGINRLSIGVQSMNDRYLAAIGRIHTSEDVKREFTLAREAGFDNISIDLMFSIPGGGAITSYDDIVDDTLASLADAIELGPDHISYYSLQLEEGTKFWRDFQNGNFREVPDEYDREMYHRGSDILEQAGYHRYEISNFAKPGYESRHNSKYWDMSDYIGFGLGASSYVHTEDGGPGYRIMNTSSVDEYIGRISKGKLLHHDIHRNSEHDDISEAVFTGLRRECGIRYDEVMRFCKNDRQKTFWEYYHDVKDDILSYEKSGHLMVTDDGIRLTDVGIDISNRIMALFI